MEMLARALLRPDLRSLQEARRRRAEGRRAATWTSRRASTPSLFTVLARVKNAGGRGVRSRSDSVDVRGRPGRRWCRPGGSPTPSRTTATRSRGRSTAPSAIAAVVARYASYRRSYQTVNNYYRTLESLDAGRSAGRGAKVLHRRRPDRHDAVEGSAAGRDREGAALESLTAPTCGVSGAPANRRRGWPSPPDVRTRQPTAAAAVVLQKSPCCRSSTSSCCSPSARRTIRSGRKGSPR